MPAKRSTSLLLLQMDSLLAGWSRQVSLFFYDVPVGNITCKLPPGMSMHTEPSSLACVASDVRCTLYKVKVIQFAIPVFPWHEVTVTLQLPNCCLMKRCLNVRVHNENNAICCTTRQAFGPPPTYSLYVLTRLHPCYPGIFDIMLSRLKCCRCICQGSDSCPAQGSR